MVGFADKVVVITGASSGIGKALALELAVHASKLILASRRKHELDEVKNMCRALNKESIIHCVAADVRIETDCKHLINQTIDLFGRIDVLINNAGISMRALFKSCKSDVFADVMQTNFWGTVYCTRAALPHLQQSGGTIASVSSIAGFQGLPARSAYSASKFALIGFMNSLRIELQKSKINTYVICPGWTQSKIRFNAFLADGSLQGSSPKNEMRLMSAQKVAKIMVRDISKRRRFRILSTEGQWLYWLASVFPRLVDRLIYNKLSKEPNSPLLHQ
jgi:NAD(P)-dependent dehydrogenase (short-subunit alcohol dehydrogenase family)